MLWGVGAVLAAMVVLSALVLTSYQGPRAAALNAAAAPGPEGEIAEPAAGAAEPAAAEPVAPPPPAPVEVPATGSGAVTVASFTRSAPADQGNRLVRVRVEVENEMPVDAEAAAQQAADILQDDRSWPAKQSVRFDFVGDRPHDLVIRILTPGTTDDRCLPLRTLGRVSCSIGRNVNLNGVRWTQGVPDYAGDLDGYRTYLVNHEVGHYLGRGHVSCPGEGKPAPVMMQQTKGLKGCARNVWP